jgi:hypothetical protein
MRWVSLIVLAPILWGATTAVAHFPFIVPDKGAASARLVMSETMDPDPDVGIDIIAGAVLKLRASDGSDTPLTLNRAERWMDLALPGEGTRVVHGVADLGVMTRGRPHRLLYHPKTIVGDPFDPSTVLGPSVPVELIPIRADGGFRLKLMVGGSPAAGAELRLIDAEGNEDDYPTDDDGLTEVFAATGRFAAWARHWTDEPGKAEGTAYEQVRRYATIVFDVPEAAPKTELEPLLTAVARNPLPVPVASFGAVASDGWIYVYGGHTARRHEYSTASVTGRFHRLNLSTPGVWEELPDAIPVQGMNLAAHRGAIYRVGGMQPRNPPGEPTDSHSVIEAARFDPAARRWTDLPPLPRPRSSHDVAVVGETLFAIGGWWQKGRGVDPEWHQTLETIDLATPGSTWRSLPQPFARRALIVAVLDGRIHVMGGFDDEDRASLDVDVYDPSTETWSAGPSIPGQERNGFSPAACAHGGAIYLSVASGDLFRLATDRWEPVARTTPRVVHRLIPNGPEILVVGGASEARMLDLVEAVLLSDVR